MPNDAQEEPRYSRRKNMRREALNTANSHHVIARSADGGDGADSHRRRVDVRPGTLSEFAERQFSGRINDRGPVGASCSDAT